MNDENDSNDFWLFDDDIDEVELTAARVTKDEVEKLVKLYLKRTDEICYSEQVYRQSSSGWSREKTSINTRISEFIKSNAIADERVTELENEIVGDTYSPVNLAKARLEFALWMESQDKKSGSDKERSC